MVQAEEVLRQETETETVQETAQAEEMVQEMEMAQEAETAQAEEMHRSLTAEDRMFSHL